MILYNYDINGYLLGQEEAQLDPLESKVQGKQVFLIPSNSTSIKPPYVGTNEIPKWTGTEWTLVENYYTDFAWNKSTGQEIRIDFRGPLPETFKQIYTLIPCPNALLYVWNETNQTWEQSIEILKAEAVKMRNYLLAQSDAKVLRYNSELLLVEKGLLSSTTNTAEEMLQWEIYRQALREWMEGWIPNKALPIQPNIA